MYSIDQLNDACYDAKTIRIRYILYRIRVTATLQVAQSRDDWGQLNR